MALSTGFEFQAPAESTGRKRRPEVPAESPIKVSELGLSELIIAQVGGPEVVQTKMDGALGDRILKWVLGAGIPERVSNVRLVSRKEFDKSEPKSNTELLVCRDSARMQHNVGGVVDAVYTYVKTSRKSWKPRNVYASSITNDRREQVLKLLGIPETDIVGAKNPEWAAVADFGTELHELAEVWLKESGFSKRSEFSVKVWWPRKPQEGGKSQVIISGRVDHEMLIGGQKYILDVKTVGSRDYSEGAHGKKFKKYIAQLNVYGEVLGIKEGIILLVDRDSGRMKEYIIELSEETGAEMLLRGRALMKCVAERRLPTAETSGFEMNFNPYKTLSLLEDKTGWVTVALNNGIEPELITPANLYEHYHGRIADQYELEAIQQLISL